MTTKPWASHARNLPRHHRLLRILGLALLTVLLSGATASALVYRDINNASNKISISNFLGDSRPQAAATKPGDSYAGRPLNVLVIGSDFRKNPERDQNGQLITGMRSDTTMVAHISADRQDVTIVSIPRDLMVKRPSCELPGGKEIAASRGLDQFNSAFSLGGQTNDVGAAVACSLRTVEELSGLYIDEFVVVDFDGFRGMIQALGGVPICLEAAVHDSFNTVNLQPGCQTLNADQALGYARARYGVGDGSDLSRIGRQQALIGAMIKEARSRNYFTDLPSLYSFLRAGLASLTTSPEFGSVSSMGGLALSLSDINPQRIRFYTLPNEYWSQNRARVVPTADADELWQALADDAQIPAKFHYRDLSGTEVTAPPVDPSANPDSAGTLQGESANAEEGQAGANTQGTSSGASPSGKSSGSTSSSSSAGTLHGGTASGNQG